MAIRAFARRLGVSERVVRKAIDTGRLERSVGQNGHGRPVIAHPDLAEREWRDNRDPAKDRTGRDRGGATAAVRRRLVLAQAKRQELAYEQARRELVPRLEVQREFAGYIVMCKTKLLGVPSRAKQRIPHLTVAEIGVLEALVREALEELAHDDGTR